MSKTINLANLGRKAVNNLLKQQGTTCQKIAGTPSLLQKR